MIIDVSRLSVWVVAGGKGVRKGRWVYCCILSIFFLLFHRVRFLFRVFVISYRQLCFSFPSVMLCLFHCKSRLREIRMVFIIYRNISPKFLYKKSKTVKIIWGRKCIRMSFMSVLSLCVKSWRKEESPNECFLSVHNSWKIYFSHNRSRSIKKH